LHSTVSGQGPVAGCCECGDEPSGSCATELVSYGIPRWKICFKTLTMWYSTRAHCRAALFHHTVVIGHLVSDKNPLKIVINSIQSIYVTLK
jgi:hypothetical protein